MWHSSCTNLRVAQHIHHEVLNTAIAQSQLGHNMVQSYLLVLLNRFTNSCHVDVCCQRISTTAVSSASAFRIIPTRLKQVTPFCHVLSAHSFFTINLDKLVVNFSCRHDLNPYKSYQIFTLTRDHFSRHQCHFDV